jgi:peptidoglycan/LPS O-acetylase OafA/YrhL
MSLWLVDWYRRSFNHAGPLVQTLGRASFTAYLVHAPIGVLLAGSMADLEVPAELKFVAVFTISAASSFALGWLLTRSQIAARIL